MKRKQEPEETMESDEEDEDEFDQPQQPSPKKLKSKFKDREFSVKEISRLKKVETMFNSSLFRMQVSELLKSVSLKQKFRSRIESAVNYLSKKLVNLPPQEEFKIFERAWLNTKEVRIPMIEAPRNVKGVFHFTPPTEVRLLGSVSLGTCVTPHIEVDLAVFISKSFLQNKDHMNQRYTRKKALYLAALASHLSECKKVQNLNYAYHMGNPLKPILIVTLKGDDEKTVNINLHVIPEDHPFKLSKFHLAKNNVRPKWFFKKKSVASDVDEENEDGSSLPATKYYNSSILQDLCMVANENYIKETLSGAEGLQQGIMLLKIWLHQRELCQGHGLFSTFLMTAYVAYLTKMKNLNKMMGSYQVFRTTLHFLSKADWQDQPPSLCNDDMVKNMPSKDEFKDAFDCVFIDCTGSYNFAYMLSSSVFKRVKHECQLSLDSLERPDQTLFDNLFMTSVPFTRKFDQIFHVRVDDKFLGDAYDKDTSMVNSELDMGMNCRTLSIEHQILTVLTKALGKRATVLHTKPIINTKWHISCPAFKYDRRSYLTFGLILDPSEAFNVINKGPVADAVEAAEFRAFWGDKSEMRRFKDGSIHEAVLWSSSTSQSDKRVICKSIVSHILKRHCEITSRDIIYRGNPLDSLLEIYPKSNSKIQRYGTGEEYSLAVLKAFEQVNRLVRNISQLPLSITSVQGVHPVFRHAEVFPPLPAGFFKDVNETCTNDHSVPCNENFLPRYIPVLPVVCGLEGSGKWPDDKDAMDAMKALLHVKMGQELKDKFSLCVSIHPTYIDVYKDGFVFRLMLACTREITLLRMLRNESGMLKFNNTDESVTLERDTVARPLHSHLIHSVQQQHPVFSATVRLCKRWLASQMIWDELREETVELMVASVFIKPFPYTSPASPYVGFLRFLNLLSTFNWKNDILMVNLNEEFAEQDYSEVPKTFKNNRGTLPAMCIATPQDKNGSVWTKESPNQLILERLVILAGASQKTLESQLISFSNDCDFKQIFRPVLEHFDITIKLMSSLNVTKHQSVDAKKDVHVHTLSSGHYSSETAMPVVDFDVNLKFVEDLQKIYGEVSFFFFDRFGGDVIGMVWKTQALEKRDFKMTNFMMRQPFDSEEKVTLKIAKNLILQDIQTLGSDIIVDITNHRQIE